ncbi:hypothetical protein HW555_012319 [Spodoptera exigua]|uniref:Uncharacterized protein n=1 Tax=Spodoptera exigua TaxID=7107 RepID=A0A835L3Q3_SPOEX|nr:hypothetical protein HW555_012319 [Spodoptera exigua]
MEIAPERHEVEYVNTKYLKNLSVVFRKFSRNSPLYVSMELESLVGVGNNMTLKMALYEYLAGHYIPTPLNVAYKFCDFFRYEPFFGQMYAKQFPENWTCPFPAGEYHFVNMTIHLENFPYTIPFTYSSMIVHTRADVQGVFTHTNEEVFRWKTFIRITQKLQPKDGKKNKAVKLNNNKELVLKKDLKYK